MVDARQIAPKWLDTTRAADYLGLDPRALLRLVNQGAVPAYRASDGLLFRRTDLDDYRDNTDVPPGESHQPRRVRLWSQPPPPPTRTEITEQTRLLAAFAAGWGKGVAPVPCPVCGEVVAKADIAEHVLRRHR